MIWRQKTIEFNRKKAKSLAPATSKFLTNTPICRCLLLALAGISLEIIGLLGAGQVQYQ
jgi:hypothetical protein